MNRGSICGSQALNRKSDRIGIHSPNFWIANRIGSQSTALILTEYGEMDWWNPKMKSLNSKPAILPVFVVLLYFNVSTTSIFFF